MFGAFETRFQGAAAAKGLRLAFERASDVPPALKGAPSRLKQALDLLIDNAIKYSERGDVTLKVGCLARYGDQVTLGFTVADQGVGIPAAALERLFDPFTQVDESTQRKHGGIGVGLAICKHLVHMLGGELSAQSVVGEGSQFSFAVTFQSLAESVSTPAQATTSGAGLPAGESPVAGHVSAALLAEARALAKLLRVDDIQAVPLWARIAPELAPHLGSRASAFQVALDDFAFDAALVELEGLLAKYPDD